VHNITKKNSALCPRFGQDRVNFHKELGGDTAELADPNWPNKTVPCAAMLCSGWGSWMRGGQLRLGRALGIRQ